MAYISFQPQTYFQTMLYTGDGSDARALTNDGLVDLQPDLIWIKCRTAGNWHDVTDSSRGVTKSIYPSESSLQVTEATSLQAFNSDGFTVGTNDQVNEDTETYAAWQWKVNAGTTASDTNGSITPSTVQVNDTAGISMVQYTGNGVQGATTGHGLTKAPTCVIVKNLGSSVDWSVGWTSMAWTKGLALNLNDNLSTDTGWWDNTAPSSTVLYFGNATTNNQSSSAMVAYCFHNVKGFSKFGSYTGTGNIDGTFVHLGFRPALVIIKNDGASKNWYMFDSARDPSNLTDRALKPDINNAEVDSSDWNSLDLLSNGFKLRGGSSGVGDDLNGSYTYQYMAFAKFPFVSSNSIPATAV